MAEKIEEALQLSEDVLRGIETEVIKTSSASLLCLRLARLTADYEATSWLTYETSGYPGNSEGIDAVPFEIAWQHGRQMRIKDKDSGQEKRRVFTEIAGALEAQIEGSKLAAGTVTTQGVSVAGEWASIAMRELKNTAVAQANTTQSLISEATKKLTILRGQYYTYALKVNLEIKFSQGADEVFRSYRLSVDKNLVILAPEAIKRFVSAYERLASENPESWNQALSSCRRVFQEIADALFLKQFPNYKESTFETKSGKKLDISGDKYVNRLYAVVDAVQTTTRLKLVGSHVMYTIDWIESLHNSLCKGVHDTTKPLTFEETRMAILHTYIAFGDLIVALDDLFTE